MRFISKFYKSKSNTITKFVKQFNRGIGARRSKQLNLTLFRLQQRNPKIQVFSKRKSVTNLRNNGRVTKTTR